MSLLLLGVILLAVAAQGAHAPAPGESFCHRSAEAREEVLPPWEPHVPSVVLRRAIAHLGDMVLFDRLLEKVVVRREPITVIGLGSSCTSEFGGRKGPQLQLLNLDAFDFIRVVNPNGWLSGALDWLSSSYPPKHNRTWRRSRLSFAKAEQDPRSMAEPYWLINLAIGAIGPKPWGECLGAAYFQKLPRKVDLVVVEWALAASYPNISDHLEGVMQRLLRMWDPPPAFLFVNFFFWCRGNLWCREFMVSQKTGQRVLVEGPQLPLNWRRIGVFSLRSFDNTEKTGDVTEDAFRMLAQYYGLPMLSMRDAFWFLAAEQVERFGLRDLIARDDMGLHPGIPLAQTTYRDVLVYFFRTAIQGFWQRRRQRTGAGAVSPPGVESPTTVLPSMTARMYPKGGGEPKRQLAACYAYDMWQATPPTVVRSSGFAFTKDPDSKIPKPGFATWKAGSFVEYVLDTSAVGKGLEFESEEAAKRAVPELEVRFLVSYARMGKAELACVRGCVCAGGVMDGTITEHWSVPEAKLFVLSQSPSCVVRITSRAGAGGEKFKIISLSLSFTRS